MFDVLKTCRFAKLVLTDSPWIGYDPTHTIYIFRGDNWIFQFIASYDEIPGRSLEVCEAWSVDKVPG